MRLEIYNALGQKITTLVNKKLSTGNYEVDFDGGNLTSGVYFYQLKTADYLETKKMLLVK
ncbi:MAG: T9SS type A sorting domain-containing protein [Melioribacteraceae bacterium]|nr:T9SS type A sorting domain-containing protein [Melioribacteraceae bacterium]